MQNKKDLLKLELRKVGPDETMLLLGGHVKAKPAEIKILVDMITDWLANLEDGVEVES